MAEPSNSLTAHLRALDAGEPVAAAAFLAGEPTLALADGRVRFPLLARESKPHPEGAILTALKDGDRLLTGGDDGLVVATSAEGVCETLADEKGKWIDALAAREGAVAWSAGKSVRTRDPKGIVKSWSAPTTVRGLAFLPKGFRVAAAHYNGVSIWFPNAVAPPQALEWKGSHLDATCSPDGRFLVTSMQENALHGWRLADGRNMRMTGYPAKSRSLSWSHDGYWLATSGAEACVVWPFKDKDGPMGKAPRECGVRPHRVTATAFHPRALVVAIGYADGLVMLCRLGDAAEILVRDAVPSQGGVSALAWDQAGARLLIGTDGGAAGLLVLPA